MNYTYFLV